MTHGPWAVQVIGQHTRTTCSAGLMHPSPGLCCMPNVRKHVAVVPSAPCNGGVRQFEIGFLCCLCRGSMSTVGGTS
jgi:hypothetical protein